jgi:signal transduction histidine kinase/streptogramin lyase/ActR/RegA family two-component response regulator
VITLLGDGGGGLWLGTWGGGANHLDPKTGKFRRYSPRAGVADSLSNIHVWRIIRDSSGQLWFATFAGGLNRYLPAKDAFERFGPIENDATSLNHERIWSLLVSKNGTFWVGTHGGLARYLPSSNSWQQYRAGTAANSLTDNCILELMEDREGMLWLGTYDGGLNRFNPGTGEFKAFTVKDGLPSNLVCGVLEDDSGNLWISSFNGLCRLDPKTGKTRVYDERDGLPTRQFTRGTKLRKSTGELLFGSVDGLVSFFPERIEPDRSSLHVVLTHFEAFNKEQRPGAADSPLKTSITQTRVLDIPSRLSAISFQFASLGFRSAESIKYEYMLEGFDQTWQRAGRDRRATYTNLSPGTYRLRIRAANREDLWFTNGEGMELIVRPAWWQNSLVRAMGLFVLLVGAVLVGWIISGKRSQARVRAAEQARLLAAEREKAAEDRERLLIQLQQAQKMESVGRLAGGVAHDFNNMLSVILGNSSLALDDPACNGQTREHLEEIKNAAQRSADLTRQLLAFARKQTIKPRVLNLNETVAGMLKMLQRLVGEQIELSWQPGESLWSVTIDPSQIDQLLANLTVNARDAIVGHGRIIIETANVTLANAHLSAHPEAVKGDYVRLSVGDNGSGMDANTREHLFEPFFTTKKIGVGTGLGLATVYGIVQQNLCKIHVQSEPGRGTVFQIFLPRSHQEGTAEAVRKERSKFQGSETLLLVEDEPQILQITQRILRQQGYTVLSTSQADEALTLAATHAGPIHLLLTDVVMPGMNGRELSERLSVVKPGVRSLFMSGYTAEIIAQHGVLGDGVDFIQKPFDNDVLLKTVRSILDGA